MEGQIPGRDMFNKKISNDSNDKLPKPSSDK